MEYNKSLEQWDDLSAHHINSHLEDYEHARSGFFQLVIDFGKDDKGNPINLLKPDFALEEPEEEDYITNGSDVIRLSVDSTTVPHYSVSDITIERGNSIVHFAGKPQWNGGTFVCRDLVGLHTKEVLMAWQKLTYDPITDKGGRGVNYKKKATLIEYTQDFVEIRRWDLIGLFPLGVEEGEFDKTKGEETRNLTVNFVYDRAFIHSAAADVR